MRKFQKPTILKMVKTFQLPIFAVIQSLGRQRTLCTRDHLSALPILPYATAKAMAARGREASAKQGRQAGLR